MLPVYFKYSNGEAGCDEAGRGCLAGPVFGAAVILPPDFKDSLLNDSKQLTAKNREKLRVIIEREAISYAVSSVMPEQIDKINILNASILSMHQSLEKLDSEPQFIVIDGNRFKPFKNIPYQCIVKGDGKYLNIAAASILAKTYRDEYMLSLHTQYPYYQWDKNKAYPTKIHRQAIMRYGTTPHHRMSFKLLPSPLQPTLFEI